jgi:low affinity Fe/Cu permease
MEYLFSQLSRRAERAVGSPWAALLALLVVIAWGITGPLFHYSDTWQLVINTGTTIVTFLMVFLIQATQTRDTEAIHVKLNEILRVLEGARNSLINAEEMEQAELDRVRDELREAAP